MGTLFQVPDVNFHFTTIQIIELQKKKHLDYLSAHDNMNDLVVSIDNAILGDFVRI